MSDSSATPAVTDPAPPPATPIIPAVPVEIPRFKRVRGRLIKIHIENYRAFRGPFELQLPHGENALIYGENGAGKSSLYHSVRDFLEAPQAEFLERDKPGAEGKKRELRLADNQHRPKSGNPKIELEFEHGKFTWDSLEDSSRKTGPWNTFVTATNKAKGFLDYRALLRIHYLPSQDGGRIDVFDLIIRQLLPNTTYFHSDYWRELRPGGLSGNGERSFAQGWADVQRRADEWHTSERWTAFQSAKKTFDEALKKQIETHLADKATEIAKRFDPSLEIRFQVEPSEFDWRPRKKLTPPRVYIFIPPSGDRGQIIDYDRFFNEARLTAISMAIFFAGLLQSPATGERLLALDDILIGLDMAHRLTVLRILEQYFKDWQVLIFTYHKAWFEILKERTSSSIWKHRWKSVVVRQEMVSDCKISLVKSDESGLLLDLAERYAARMEHKSAAVHARTALEVILSRFCCSKKLPVIYVENQNKQTNHHFLHAINLWLSRVRSPVRYATWLALSEELNHSLRFVLHSYSHKSLVREDEFEGEVVSAIKTVRLLEHFLNSVRNRELADDPIPVWHRKFHYLIEDAITTPIPKRCDLAVRSFSFAVECFLLSELPERGVSVDVVNDANLWKQLFSKAKLTKHERMKFAEIRKCCDWNLKDGKITVEFFNASVLNLLQMRFLSDLKKRKQTKA